MSEPSKRKSNIFQALRLIFKKERIATKYKQSVADLNDFGSVKVRINSRVYFLGFYWL